MVAEGRKRGSPLSRRLDRMKEANSSNERRHECNSDRDIKDPAIDRIREKGSISRESSGEPVDEKKPGISKTPTLSRAWEGDVDSCLGLAIFLIVWLIQPSSLSWPTSPWFLYTLMGLSTGLALGGVRFAAHRWARIIGWIVLGPNLLLLIIVIVAQGIFHWSQVRYYWNF